MLRRLLLVQGGARLQGAHLFAGGVAVVVLPSVVVLLLPSVVVVVVVTLVVVVAVMVVVVAMMVDVVVARVCLLDGRPHTELGEPVHGGQAALQLRGHACGGPDGSGRKEGGVEEAVRCSARVPCGTGGVPSTNSLDGLYAEALTRVWKNRRRDSVYCLVIS